MPFKPMQHTDGRSIPFTSQQMWDKCKEVGIFLPNPQQSYSKAHLWRKLDSNGSATPWLDQYYGSKSAESSQTQQNEGEHVSEQTYPISKSAMIALLRKHGQSTGDTARTTVAEYWQQIVAAGLEEEAKGLTRSTANATVAEHGSAGSKLAEALREVMGDTLDRDAVRGIVAEYCNKAVAEAVEKLPPKRFEFVQFDGTVKIVEGRVHKMFERLLRYVKADLNVWLTGPAGSGKTTAARVVADALGLPFYFNGSVDTEYKLLGFSDANSRVVRTPFREAWEKGGVYLFDEIDGSLPPAILAVNAALAGDLCAFPDGVIQKHKDCRIIAAANTWGHGATMEFVGRMKLDAASLDRFVKLAWDYDEALELEIAPDRKWTEYVQQVRAKARAKGLKVIISPRASFFGARLIAAGDSWEDAAMATMGFGLAPEQWQAIK